MRNINPLPRSVTIPCVSGLTSNFAEFQFTEDCVLQSIVSQVAFSAAIGTSGAFAGGFNAYTANGSLFLTNGTTTPAVHYYRYSPPIGAAGQAQFSNRTPFENVLVQAGTKFTVKIELSGLCDVKGSFSLQFSPLSEWVNFREPRVAVRI